MVEDGVIPPASALWALANGVEISLVDACFGVGVGRCLGEDDGGEREDRGERECGGAAAREAS